MSILMTCDRTTLLFLISLCYFGSNNIFISGVDGNLAKKIYGGKAVKMYKYTQVVSVQFREHHVCGGVIISDRLVVTSASCVLDDLYVAYGNLKVLTGTGDLFFGYEDVFAKFHEVASVIFHIDYKPRDAWKNDIAILKTASKIDCTVIRLSSEFLPKMGMCSGLYVFGWGVNPYTQIMTRYLQILSVQTMNHYACNQKYFHLDYLHKHQHCLVLPETAHITQGDGGNPIIRGKKVIGIISAVSWNLHDPTVYTRLYGYRSWIEEIMLETSSSV